jgi:hypothetical protein
MTISGLSTSSVLADLADNGNASDVKFQASVSMLKRANDQITQQGAALVSMIEQAGAPAMDQPRLDVYA